MQRLRDQAGQKALGVTRLAILVILFVSTGCVSTMIMMSYPYHKHWWCSSVQGGDYNFWTDHCAVPSEAE